MKKIFVIINGKLRYCTVNTLLNYRNFLFFLPTNTVYGMFCFKETLKRIFELKKRDLNKPVSRFTVLKRVKDLILELNIAHQTHVLCIVNMFLKYCTTVILHNDITGQNIGFRVSDTHVLKRFTSNEDMYATSVNLSSQNSITTYDGVLEFVSQHCVQDFIVLPQYVGAKSPSVLVHIHCNEHTINVTFSRVASEYIKTIRKISDCIKQKFANSKFLVLTVQEV